MSPRQGAVQPAFFSLRRMALEGKASKKMPGLRHAFRLGSSPVRGWLGSEQTAPRQQMKWTGDGIDDEHRKSDCNHAERGACVNSQPQQKELHDVLVHLSSFTFFGADVFTRLPGMYCLNRWLPPRQTPPQQQQQQEVQQNVCAGIRRRWPLL